MRLLLPNAGGRSYWPLQLPTMPVFVGATFFAQAMVFDYGVNSFNAVVSNALELRIGGR